MSDRGLSPAIGVVLLTALTVLAATAVGTAVVVDTPSPVTNARVDAEADASGEIRITHQGGDAIDPDSLRVRIAVDGSPLAEQPPVPFFSAKGFESGPTGPFNSATGGSWEAGETATLRVAATNHPTLRRGATVEVRLYVDERRISTIETTVQAASTASASVTASVASSASSSSSSGT